MTRATRQQFMCPNVTNHTPSPSRYVDWHSWADQMAKKHRQRMCRGCMLYEIWTPKARP